MRILMVSSMLPYLPCHDGFRIIPANLLRVLSGRHEIHLVSHGSGEETVEQLAWAEKYCAEMLTIDQPNRKSRLLMSGTSQTSKASAFRATVAEQIRLCQPDILHLEGPGLAPYAEMAPSATKTVLSAHDSLSLRYRQFATFANSPLSKISSRFRSFRESCFERKWYHTVDHVIVTSDSDVDALSRAVPPGRLTAIPNGIDFDYWKYQFDPKPGHIVFTGNMAWPPNVDAVEFFAREVFPAVREKVPHARFMIVGASPSPRVTRLAELPGVQVTGTVPDVRPWVWDASVYVSPLRFGAGVKNKILEAMALGTPIVATPSSLTGSPLEDRRHALIAEEAPAIGKAVLELLSDAELRQSLSISARGLVEQRYSWEAIATRFEAVYAGEGGVV